MREQGSERGPLFSTDAMLRAAAALEQAHEAIRGIVSRLLPLPPLFAPSPASSDVPPR